MLLVALSLCVPIAAGEEVEEQQCPAWHFTPDNASKPCSQCGPLRRLSTHSGQVLFWTGSEQWVAEGSTIKAVTSKCIGSE